MLCDAVLAAAWLPNPQGTESSKLMDMDCAIICIVTRQESTRGNSIPTSERIPYLELTGSIGSLGKTRFQDAGGLHGSTSEFRLQQRERNAVIGRWGSIILSDDQIMEPSLCQEPRSPRPYACASTQA